MWSINLQSISLFILVSVAWFFGGSALINIVSDFGNQWYWLLIATAYTTTLNEIFAHQICNHRPYDLNTRSWTFRLITFLTTVDHAWGPITSISTLHANHHENSDRGITDNEDIKRFWYNVCILAPWMFIYQSRTTYPGGEEWHDQQKKIHNDLLDDNWVFFCEYFRVPLTIIFWVLMYFLLPEILFNVIFLGRVLASIFMLLASIGGHTRLPFGYRNFNTDDNTHNNLLFFYLTLGLWSTMLHNNHHGTTSDRHSYRWFEVDLGNLVIRALRPLIAK